MLTYNEMINEMCIDFAKDLQRLSGRELQQAYDEMKRVRKMTDKDWQKVTGDKCR